MFLLFFAIIYPPDSNRLKFFRSFSPWTPTRVSPSLECLQAPTFILGQFCNLFLWNITFKNSIFFRKLTLVKLLGSLIAWDITHHTKNYCKLRQMSGKEVSQITWYYDRINNTGKYFTYKSIKIASYFGWL